MAEEVRDPLDSPDATRDAETVDLQRASLADPGGPAHTSRVVPDALSGDQRETKEAPDRQALINAPDTELRTDEPRDATLVWNESENGVRSLTGWISAPVTRDQNGPGSSETAPRLPAAQLSFSLPGLIVEALVGKSIALVYRAYQPALRRHVALKVLPPAFADDPVRIKRFYREAETASRFFSGSILPIYDLLEYQGQPIIVMPYVDGGTLDAVIADRRSRRSGRPEDELHPWANLDDLAYVETVLPILDQVVQSVATLHEHKTIHRDIKPANLLLDRSGRVWLSDFGLARLQEDCPLTRQGQAVGTPGYMSPEQCMGSRDLGPETDVFGLAATLYRVLTLTFPYGNYRVARSSPRPLPPSKLQPKLTTDFDYVLLKGLEPNPEHRYPNAIAFAKDWTAARKHEGKQIRKRDRILSSLRRHSKVLATSGILSVAMTASIGLAMIRGVGSSGDPDSVNVVVKTKPGKAQVALVRLDPLTHGVPVSRATQKLDSSKIIRTATNLDGTASVRLPPGIYLVESGVPGQGFRQAYRSVPQASEISAISYLSKGWSRLPDGAVVLDEIEINADDAPQSRPMALINGDTEFLPPPPWDTALIEQRRPMKGMPSFYLDCHEVTMGDFVRVLKRTPLKWPKGRPYNDQQPAAGVSFVEAMEYAERVGLRLPTDGEMRYVYHSLMTPIIPTSLNLIAYQASLLVNHDHDRTATNQPVTGLRVGQGEWSQTPMAGNNFGSSPSAEMAERRLVFGSRFALMDKGNLTGLPPGKPTEPMAVPYFETGIGIGFRCARSASPLLLDPKQGAWSP